METLRNLYCFAKVQSCLQSCCKSFYLNYLKNFTHSVLFLILLAHNFIHRFYACLVLTDSKQIILHQTHFNLWGEFHCGVVSEVVHFLFDFLFY